ncbi:hypothetical protein Hdeb2414_s0002g00044041 [Helianthus debilis subsp. tardiflorus]
MEAKLPLIANKVWSLVRAILFTLKKDISKRKLLVNLNMMMKQGKMARKSPSDEYEFSCSNTPRYPLSLFSTHNKSQNNCHLLVNPNPPLAMDDCDDITINPAVIKVLHTLSNDAVYSPFTVAHGLEDGQVDKAADKFIRRFFSDLKKQDK